MVSILNKKKFGQLYIAVAKLLIK